MVESSSTNTVCANHPTQKMSRPLFFFSFTLLPAFLLTLDMWSFYSLKNKSKRKCLAMQFKCIFMAIGAITLAQELVNDRTCVVIEGEWEGKVWQ